jgi:serine phosphatase RsbU (regulator of sigma subunit)
MFSKSTDNSNNPLNQALLSDRRKFKKFFVYPIAENLFSSIKKSDFIDQSSDNINENFKKLSETEKSFWYDYASQIPDKLKTLDLFVHPFEGYCRTCIITDKEISTLAQIDNNSLIYKESLKKIKDQRQFFIELNWLIPVALKNIGYEVIRYEEVSEINILMVRKLARAIHSRYLHEIRNQNLKADSFILYNSGKAGDQYAVDFDDLPDEIKYSNIDNATHIPTKLLSIGYKIRQVKKGFKPFALHLHDDEVETMARVEHMRWSWEKRLNGWTLGEVKDDIKKTHPSLIPYEQLSESEKEKDRELVKLIPAFLQDIDYEAYPVSPNRFKKLSYAIKPQSSIHKILDETRELNEHIRSFVTLTPEIEEMIRIRNKKIEEAIHEVEGSYNYAQHIQETFLTEDLFIRECFPDSFVLFKPKDIVSGDFHFFSRNDHLIIFAAVDCTGHGIPGALLSTLGYGIIDQAVNEIKLTDTSHILNHLYCKIHKYLRNDSDGTGISDDMDIILCILDTRTNILTYSGIKNPLYRVSKGELIEYQAQNEAGAICDKDGCQFSSTIINLDISDTLYLGSDGFPDQFGGKFHKKYQSARLKKFLISIQGCSMPEQSDRLYEELEKWREENNEEQTDDILIIGIRI